MPRPMQRISVPTGYRRPAAALCCACVPTCLARPCWRAATRFLHPQGSDPRSTAAAHIPRLVAINPAAGVWFPALSDSATPIQWALMVTRDSTTAHRSPLNRPVCGSSPSCRGRLPSRRSLRQVHSPCPAHAGERTRARRRYRPSDAFCGLALAFGALASVSKSL